MSLTTSQPLIFGEVLFDEFENGDQVLGGAPFNVAWHVKGFGLSPVFVSCIGEDEAGRKVLQAMQRWNMNRDGLQQDAKHNTGRVTIKLANGQPDFEIHYPAAFDFINNDTDRFVSSITPALLYHGSLVARSEISAATLQAIRKKGISTFVDVNLRRPWWNKEQIAQLVSGVDWVKLNDDELQVLSSISQADLRKQAEIFLAHHNIRNLVVTRGAQGAWLLTKDSFVSSEPVKVKNMMDTVGAGDAFSAVCLLGIIRQWPIELTLERASEFASAVCEQRGATSFDQSLYDSFMESWQ